MCFILPHSYSSVNDLLKTLSNITVVLLGRFVIVYILTFKLLVQVEQNQVS